MFPIKKSGKQPTLTQMNAVVPLGQLEEEETSSSQESVAIPLPVVSASKKQKRESVLQNLSSGDEEDSVQTGHFSEPSDSGDQNESPSPPTVARSTSTVAAFCAAKVKKDFCTPVIKEETKTSGENTGQQTPAKHYVPPDYHLTPSRDEKRQGVWVTGAAICIEDYMKTKIINNNISEAIGEYIDRVHKKRTGS